MRDKEVTSGLQDIEACWVFQGVRFTLALSRPSMDEAFEAMTLKG